MTETLNFYLHYYRKFLSQRWDDVGPQDYVFILVAVGVIGWYLMRKGPSVNA